MRRVVADACMASKSGTGLGKPRCNPLMQTDEPADADAGRQSDEKRVRSEVADAYLGQLLMSTS